jgi:methyl-accepting chemotaxis protein
MTLANLKIGQKLCVGFACVLLVVALMSAGLIVSLRSLDAASVAARNANAVVDDMDLTIAAVHEESLASLRFLLLRNERFARIYDDASKSFADNLARARSDGAGHAEILALLDRVEAAGAAYRHDVSDEVVRLTRANPNSDLALQLADSDRATEVLEAFKGVAADARAQVNAFVADAQAQCDRLMSLLNRTVTLGAATAFLLAMLIGWWMSRIIATPVTNMTDVMKKLAGGDHAIDIPGLGRRDELGLMAEAVQAFKNAAIAKVKRDAAEAESIKAWQKEDEARAAKTAEEARQDQLVITGLAEGLGRLAGGDLAYRIETPFAPKTAQLRADFNAALEKLQQTMASIRANTGCLASGSGEIAQAADDLSRRTEQQAAGLEQTAATLNQITATVKNTAEGAVRAQTVVSTAKSEADHGGDVVREAITAMGEIERSSKQIGQIIGVIDEIAFQTNLLALNAGVEAARAGDAGPRLRRRRLGGSRPGPAFGRGGERDQGPDLDLHRACRAGRRSRRRDRQGACAHRRPGGRDQRRRRRHRRQRAGAGERAASSQYGGQPDGSGDAAKRRHGRGNHRGGACAGRGERGACSSRRPVPARAGGARREGAARRRRRGARTGRFGRAASAGAFERPARGSEDARRVRPRRRRPQARSRCRRRQLGGVLMNVQEGAVARIELPEILDLNAAAPLAVEFLSRRGEAVSVDASRVERIGGQCLQVLLSAVNTWKADAVPLAIVGASSSFTDGLARLGVALAELIDGELTQ